MYRFNEAGQLRRAFVDGVKYQALDGTLVRLQQDRSLTDRVQLLRQELSHDEARVFRLKMQERLSSLLEGLRAGRVTQQAAVPDDSDVVAELVDVLPMILAAEPWAASRMDDGH